MTASAFWSNGFGRVVFPNHVPRLISGSKTLPQAHSAHLDGQELAKWEEFQRRYRAELQTNAAVEQLQQLQHDQPIITFVYAAHDTEHNSALVLKAFLEEHPERP